MGKEGSALATLATPSPLALGPISRGSGPLIFWGVTSRSGRGRWQRVIDARRQAREALGRDPNQGDLFNAPPKRVTPQPSTLPTWPTERPAERPDESQRVLSLGEAAARLGVSRVELEAMVAAGRIEALPTGFIRMIPTREIERLARA
jgi:excisionase family DNA binding protein